MNIYYFHNHLFENQKAHALYFQKGKFYSEKYIQYRLPNIATTLVS